MPEFGTSGLRGLNVDLTDELCATYAAAFTAQHADGGVVYVGQDQRQSSPRIAAAVASGIMSEGAKVVSCGVLPTPALALAAARAHAVAIMVTGSHIPADRNGLKFYTKAGEFTKADEGPLVADVASRAAPVVTDANLETTSDAKEAYVARYVTGIAGAPLTGMKIGFWAHSSAAEAVIPDILRGLGADVVVLGQSSAFVPVDTEAVDADTRQMLAGWVAEHGLDAVVSTDGDADRPLMVDGNGDLVPGDILGPIAARWLGAETVVTTVSANTLVDLMQVFPRVARTKIGSPYVIAEMEAGMAGGEKVVGYEPNGGFLLGWDVTSEGCRLRRLATRDCVLPLVATLAAAAQSNRAVSELLADFPQRRTATDRLKDIPRERSLALVSTILDGDTSILPPGLGELTGTETTDGVRLTFDSGTVLMIRPSGNAPELRCYVEADGSADAQTVLQETLTRLRRALA